MVGAILTQNTSWPNVEKAIKNLKGARLLRPHLILKHQKRIPHLIKPAGYYNLKSKRLINFMRYLAEQYQGEPASMKRVPTQALRQELLSVNGIGPETADSILLYGLGKPIFVVDAYTRRIFSRHKMINQDTDYDEIQRFFMNQVKPGKKIYNEFHALIVHLGKTHCHKNEPDCPACPLNSLPR